MFGLKIFVRVQIFRRVPPVLPCNFCHPDFGSDKINRKRESFVFWSLGIHIVIPCEIVMYSKHAVHLMIKHNFGSDKINGFFLKDFINKVAGHPLVQGERCLHMFLTEVTTISNILKICDHSLKLFSLNSTSPTMSQEKFRFQCKLLCPVRRDLCMT